MKVTVLVISWPYLEGSIVRMALFGEEAWGVIAAQAPKIALFALFLAVKTLGPQRRLKLEESDVSKVSME